MDIGRCSNDVKPRLWWCVTALVLNNFVTPLITMAFAPFAPILIVEELHYPAMASGGIFSFLVVGIIFGFLSMPVLLAAMPVRTLLLGAHLIRIASGALWAAALYLPGATSATAFDGVVQPDWTLLSLLYVSRLMYGFTSCTIGAAGAWVGWRCPAAWKARAVAMTQGALVVGMECGPLVGVGLEWASGGSMDGYRGLGSATIVASVIMIFIIQALLRDHNKLSEPIEFYTEDTSSTSTGAITEMNDPTQKARGRGGAGTDSRPTEAEQKAYSTISFTVMVAMFAQNVSMTGGFESTIGLAIHEAYGFEGADGLRIWVPWATTAIVFNVIIIPFLVDSFNPAQVCMIATFISSGTLLGINWLDLSRPVPWWWYCLDNIFINGYTIYSTLSFSILASRLPSTWQTSVNSKIPLVGQIGRAIGPAIAVSIFMQADRLLPAGGGAGANASRMYPVVCGALGIWLPSYLNFDTVYGSFDARSPKQRREEESNSRAFL